MLEIKHLPIPKSFYIQWHITERCNLRCKHCYQDNSYINNELDFNSLCNILDSYIKTLKIWKIRGSISITGGEPLIREDFFDILEKIYEHRDRLRCMILTNGVLIDENVAKRLKQLKVGVQLSLEGMKKTNDMIRGNGTFEKITRAAKILVAEQVPTMISFTSSKGNYMDYFKVIELCKKIGVGSVWTDRLVPCGKGLEMKNLMLEPFKVKKFYEKICKISQKLEKEKCKTEVHTFRSLFPIIERNMAYICFGKEALTIMPNGDVFPCRRLPIKIGNLMNESLLEIWYSSNFLHKLRDKNNLSDKCVNCKFFNECNGGARCIAYAYWKDVFAPDPQCWIRFKKLPNPEKNIYKKSFDKELINISDLSPCFQLEKNKLFYVKGLEKFIIKNNSQIVDKAFYDTIEPTKKNLDLLLKKFTNNDYKTIIFSFKFNRTNMNEKTGKLITNFLQKMSNKKIKFILSKALPTCLFNFQYGKMMEKSFIPKSCINCPQLLRINNNSLELCRVVNKKAPSINYFNNRNQIYEYFKIFYDEMGAADDICKGCICFLRKTCNGKCFKNN